MSEYALYLATVLLVVISIATSKLAFGPPADRVIQHATIEHARNTSFHSESLLRVKTK